MVDRLSFVPAVTRPDLLADPVRVTIQKWSDAPWIEDVQVTEIDPIYAGGVELCSHFDLDVRSGGNCVLVNAKRGSQVQRAACLVATTMRADLNGLVKRTLGVRQVSLLAREDAVEESRMEYGSITVIGLPDAWPTLVDSSLSEVHDLVIGSGRVNSKLRLPGHALVKMTDALVLEHLGRPSG